MRARAIAVVSALALLAGVPSSAVAQPAASATPGRVEFRALGEDGQTVGDLKAGAGVEDDARHDARREARLAFFRGLK